MAEQVAAWNAGDGQAYARQLAVDASFTNVFGMVMYGAPAFAQRHTEILATFYKGTTKHHAIRPVGRADGGSRRTTNVDVKAAK